MMGKMTFLTVGDPMGVSVMGMERRTEQLISWSKSQLRVSDNTHAERGTQVLCG